MAITYVGSATGTTGATPPAHQKGDLFFVVVSGSGGPIPDGWCSLYTAASTSRIAYRFARSSSETCSGFTGGSGLVLSVYRGVGAVGKHEQISNTTSNPTWPAVTTDRSDSTSWALAAIASSSGTENYDVAPTGYTNRNYTTSGNRVGIHDSNGPVTLSTGQFPGVTASEGSSTSCRRYHIELQALPSGYADRPIVMDVAETLGSGFGASGTSMNMPTGIVAGELLMAFVSCDLNDTMAASGWTDIQQQGNGTANRHAVFAKIAAGSDTITVTGNSSADFVCHVVRIDGHGVSNVATDIITPGGSTGNDTGPDIGANATGSQLDYLHLMHIATDGAGSQTQTVSEIVGVGVIDGPAQSVNASGSCWGTVCFGNRAIATYAAITDISTITSETWITAPFAIPPEVASAAAATDHSFWWAFP